MNQGNRLTWIFGIALVAALMVIAFLLGRGQAPSTTETTVAESSVDEVAAYLTRIDSIQAGPAGMSADAFAQQIAADAVQGKSDGFDQLQTDLERMQEELGRVKPPAACRELHELTLSAAGDAELLMSDLRRAFGGDASNASQLAARAQAAQEKTKRIEALRAAIETKYGLKK
jgi:hypothetical protein